MRPFSFQVWIRLGCAGYAANASRNPHRWPGMSVIVWFSKKSVWIRKCKACQCQLIYAGGHFDNFGRFLWLSIGFLDVPLFETLYFGGPIRFFAKFLVRIRRLFRKFPCVLFSIQFLYGSGNMIYISLKCKMNPVLCIRIRIGSDPHYFFRIRTGINSKTIPNTYIFYFFTEHFSMLSKILKIMTSLPLMRKEKHCKLALLWMKVKFFRYFQTCVKLKVGSSCGSASTWKFVSGSRTVIKTMPIYNTGWTKVC